MIRGRHRAWRNLPSDRRGATVVEFAIITPVFLIMLMGMGDIMYQSYAQSLLDGAMQKAARDSSIEGGADKAGEIDRMVEDMVKRIAYNAEFKPPERVNYLGYSHSKPESFTDANRNNRYDSGECFDDVNGNGVWNAAPGTAGQGRASDVTRYTREVTYPRLFPVAGLMGVPDKVTIRSMTFLKNQPYASSQDLKPVETIC